MTTPSEQLQTELTKAASTTIDGVTQSRRSLSELIEYDKYLASKNATANPAGALQAMTVKIVPPGGH